MSYPRPKIGRRPWNEIVFEQFERESGPDPTDGAGGSETGEIARDILESAFTYIVQDLAIVRGDEEATEAIMNARRGLGTAYAAIFGERPPTLPAADQAD